MNKNRFVINICSTSNVHNLRVFYVPEDVMERELPNNSNDPKEVAGWYYINQLDPVSCTGNYQWSVMTYETYLKAASYPQPKVFDYRLIESLSISTERLMDNVVDRYVNSYNVKPVRILMDIRKLTKEFEETIDTMEKEHNHEN